MLCYALVNVVKMYDVLKLTVYMLLMTSCIHLPGILRRLPSVSFLRRLPGVPLIRLLIFL